MSDDELSLKEYVDRHSICYARIYDEDCNAGDIKITYFCDESHRAIALSAFQKESGELEGMTDEQLAELWDKHGKQGIYYEFIVSDKEHQDKYVNYKRFWYDHMTQMDKIYRMDPVKYGDKIRFGRPDQMPDILDPYKHELTHYFYSGCSTDSRNIQFFTKDGCSKVFKIC